MKQYTIETRNKIYTFYNDRYKLKPSTRGWYRFDCFNCGGDYTMGINLKQSKLHCFKCGFYVSPAEGIRQLMRFDTMHQVWNLLKEYEVDSNYKETEDKIVESKPVKLPKSFKLLYKLKQDSLLGNIAANYLVKTRGFSLSKLSQAGVGYCISGKYAGYIIFPYYANGKLIFYQGRKFTEFGTKMKNPPLEEFGVGKSQVIYNQDALFLYKRTYCVESITNALTLGDKAFAISGKSASSEQIQTILKSPCEEIVIILDKDAIDKAIELALILCDYKKIKIVFMPTDDDVNAIGRKKTMQLIKKSKWVNYREIFKLKLEYGSQSILTYN